MRKALLAIAFVGCVAAASGVTYADQSPNHGPVAVSRIDTFGSDCSPFVITDSTPDETIEALSAAGWHGNALDSMEALYPPDCDDWPLGDMTVVRLTAEDTVASVLSWLDGVTPVGDVTGPDGAVHTGCDAYPVDDDGDTVLLCDDGFTEQS